MLLKKNIGRSKIKKIYECSCGTEGIEIETDRDDPKDLIYVAFWEMAFRRPRDIIHRIRSAFKILFKDEYFTDMVCLRKKEAIDFAEALIKEANLKND